VDTGEPGDPEEELADAQKYLEQYKNRKDKDYLRMAKEELSHAEKFLTELQKAQPQSQRFSSAYARYNKLKTEIESHL